MIQVVVCDAGKHNLTMSRELCAYCELERLQGLLQTGAGLMPGDCAARSNWLIEIQRACRPFYHRVIGPPQSKQWYTDPPGSTVGANDASR